MSDEGVSHRVEALEAQAVKIKSDIAALQVAVAAIELALARHDQWPPNYRYEPPPTKKPD
jgi:hypothetical protein